MTTKPDVILYLSDARGQYIPRDFARDTKRECISGIDPADLDYLAEGPDQEHYWDTWDAILSNAIITSPDTGVQYTVQQDGDCWLVPVGMKWNDREGWQWPTNED